MNKINSFDDPVFKKTKRQVEVIDTIVSTPAKNINLVGGSRSGKSFLIMYSIIVRASLIKSDHLAVRSTIAAARSSIWQKTLPDVLRLCFPKLRPKLNHTDHICYLANGSSIRISGLDDTKRAEALLGSEYSTLWFNESNQIPFSGVNKLKTRLAQKNDLRKLCFYDLNPTKTTSWVYQLFEQKVNPEDGEMLGDPENYLSIRMNPQDNLENIDSDYISMLEKLPEKERLRFLKGEYDNENSGAAVYAFNQDEHVSEEAKRLTGTDWVGSDFNIDHNSDILASQHANGLYIWDEIQIAGDTFKKADEIIKKGVIGATVIADSTGGNRSTKGKSDFIILKDAGFTVMKTLNPAVPDKIANLNRCFTLGLIKINPRCKKLIRDLLQLKWNKHGELDQKTDPSLSHLVDCLAYLAWYLYPLKERFENRFHIGRAI
jgi:PBSX family phage terminase large subunit